LIESAYMIILMKLVIVQQDNQSW